MSRPEEYSSAWTLCIWTITRVAYWVALGLAFLVFQLQKPGNSGFGCAPFRTLDC